MLWFWVCFLGCAFRAPETAREGAERRYLVRMDSTIGPLLSDDGEQKLHSGTDLQLKLSLGVQAVRRFRDGSVGHRVHFQTAELSKEGHTWDGLELAGKAVELRTFPDGEILTIGWNERIAGANRFMDVFEVMFPAISPAPPSIKPKEQINRRIIWPFMGPDRLRWDSAVDAVWTNGGIEERGGLKAWRISYDGPWRIHGGRRRGEEPVQFKAIGAATGTVWIDRQTGDLLAHTFDWSREVTVKGDGGQLSQRQTFTGTVEGVP